MDQEIELKFIVETEGVNRLRQQLNSFNAEHVSPVQLLNIYYETADNWLRRHNMGLRVRRLQEHCEMTLKIAGRVIGGLHVRPEYNIALDTPELALEKLPAEIWPEGRLPEGLSDQVMPLFSTDFQREKWLIKHGDSRIEVALDLGEVKAGELNEPLCELELELQHGNVNDILDLAGKLLITGVLRQGSLSKAARGYHLAQGNGEKVVKEAQFTEHDSDALEAAFAHWQYHEELWIHGNDDAKSEVLRAVNFIRHCLAAEDEMASEQMVFVSQRIGNGTDAQSAAFDPRIARAKLMLTAILVGGKER